MPPVSYRRRSSRRQRGAALNADAAVTETTEAADAAGLEHTGERLNPWLMCLPPPPPQEKVGQSEWPKHLL